MKDLHIDISKILETFKKHFQTKDNTKIVFSGRYGSGKSYFLQNFFNDKDIRKKFCQVTLSPINYVISSNEDVFDLIKIDILKQLYLDGNFKIQETAEKTSNFKLLKKYAQNKPLELISNLSSSLSKVSGISDALSGISENVIKLIDDFQKFESDLNKSSSQKLDEFASEHIETKNTYLENNLITQLISEHLKGLSSETKRRNILIIEDFDRIDPGHIFRILNIFSAHQEHDGLNHKFGFDKVILVCDLDNIEHIYRHIYGVETDFQGYINKFYSFEPFYFDNRDAITFHLQEVLKVQLPDYALKCLTEILVFFIKQGDLSLRKIVQTKIIPQERNYDFVLFTIPDNELFNLRRWVNIIENPEILFNKDDLKMLPILRILKNIFGSYEKLQIVLNKKSQTVYSFSPEAERNIFKTLALSVAFVDRVKDYQLFLFKEYKQNDFNFPELNINGHFFTFQHKWKNGNPYEGTESFFNEVNIQSKFNPQYNNQNVTLNILFHHMVHLIRNLGNMGYLYY